LTTVGGVWQIKSEITENELLKDTITKYRDDADLQNLIDWVQAEWASNCCVQLPWHYTNVFKLIINYQVFAGNKTFSNKIIQFLTQSQGC